MLLGLERWQGDRADLKLWPLQGIAQEKQACNRPSRHHAVLFLWLVTLVGRAVCIPESESPMILEVGFHFLEAAARLVSLTCHVLLHCLKSHCSISCHPLLLCVYVEIVQSIVSYFRQVLLSTQLKSITSASFILVSTYVAMDLGGLRTLKTSPSSYKLVQDAISTTPASNAENLPRSPVRSVYL